jgi:hypothetical protein
MVFLARVLLAALFAVLLSVSLAFDLTRPLEVTVLLAFALAAVLLVVLAGFSLSWTLRHRGDTAPGEGRDPADRTG